MTITHLSQCFCVHISVILLDIFAYVSSVYVDNNDDDDDVLLGPFIFRFYRSFSRSGRFSFFLILVFGRELNWVKYYSMTRVCIRVLPY